MESEGDEKNEKMDDDNNDEIYYDEDYINTSNFGKDN